MEAAFLLLRRPFPFTLLLDDNLSFLYVLARHTFCLYYIFIGPFFHEL
jgi:hypothetical protein